MSDLRQVLCLTCAMLRGCRRKFRLAKNRELVRCSKIRAGKHGFTIPDTAGKEPDVAVNGRRTWRFTRQGQTFTLATATYEGRLEVTDPLMLRQALTHGIGPAKGYGCGLLTLARAN